MIESAYQRTPNLPRSGACRVGLVAFVALTLLLASLSPVISAAGASAQEEQGGTAAYAPETALFYANVELDQDSAQWELAAELIDRAGISDLVPAEDLADLQTGLSQVGGVLNGEAGLILATLPDTGDFSLDSVGGDAAGIATDPAAVSEGDVPEGWSVVIRPSNARALYDTIRDTVLSSDGDDPESAQTVEYEGYTIEYVEPIDEFGTGAAIALVDDVVVISTRPDDVEPIIDTATGTVAPLSEFATYSDLRDRLEPEVLSFGFVNGPAILTGVEEQDPEALAEVPEGLVASLDAYTTFAFWADQPGFRLDTLSLPGEGQELPQAETFDPTFPDAIEGNSIAYAGGTNLGQNPGVNALALLFAQELAGIDANATPVATQDPEAYADEVFAEAEATLGFNIKTDLLDNMVGEWGVAFAAEDIVSIQPMVSGIFASDVEDATAVGDVVSKITAIAEAGSDGSVEISSREVDGSSVTTIDASSSGFPIVIEFGVVGDQLLVGINEGIDTFVDGPEESLADNPNFQATLDALPAEFSAISFVNVESLVPLIEDAVTATSPGNMPDADPACEEFATQEDAQAAYDEHNFDNFALDQDFDGTACEDFFAEGEATPEATPAFAETINVQSVGTVLFQEDGASGTSTIILIGD
ncbi:MAG TPA: DUF3352 domain-containing protein [Thermomicrobiales bacterium]|nr:DUF3352 domain-containing protein [Thermomicrobiales bacterium]